MQIYVYFLIMQKIIIIFVGRLVYYAAKNTDRLDIFSDFGSRVPVRDRPGFFPVRACSFYICLLCCPCIIWIHQYIKLQ